MAGNAPASRCSSHLSVCKKRERCHDGMQCKFIWKLWSLKLCAFFFKKRITWILCNSARIVLIFRSGFWEIVTEKVWNTLKFQYSNPSTLNLLELKKVLKKNFLKKCWDRLFASYLIQHIKFINYHSFAFQNVNCPLSPGNLFWLVLTLCNHFM